MIEDTLLTFADGVAAGNTGTRLIGDIVDLKGVGTASNAGLNSNIGGQRDAGSGEPVYLNVSVDEAFLFSGVSDHAYTIQLVTGNDANLSDAVVIASSGNPNTTDIAIGTTLWQQALPIEGTAYRRYIGLQEVVVGTTSTGKINAALVNDQHTTKFYTAVTGAF